MGCGQKAHDEMVTDRDNMADQLEENPITNKMIPLYVGLVDIRDKERLTLEERKEISKLADKMQIVMQGYIEKPQFCQAMPSQVFSEIVNRYKNRSLYDSDTPQS